MRPGRSSASSSASGMFVAIMTRIRYLGGGFGRMPSARRPQRLIRPRGFFSPDSSVSSACSVPCPPPPPMPFMPPMTNRLRVAGGLRRVVHRLAGEHPAGVVGQVGHAVAARALERRAVPGAAAARPDLRERAAAAERVGLVEEHDHAAVAQRELAQLAEQRLDLEDADAHEHVVERAGVDEDVGPARSRPRRPRPSASCRCRAAPRAACRTARSRPSPRSRPGSPGRRCSP